MKPCSSCGLNSSEIALYCQSCGTAFPAATPESSAPPLPAPETQNGGKASLLPSERWLRIFELLLVCFVGFGGALFLSYYILFTGIIPASTMRGEFRWWHSIFHEIGILALVWYVLQRRSLNFSDLGFYWKTKEVVIAPLLWIACTIVAYFSKLTVRSFGGFPAGSNPNAQAEAFLFSGGIGIATFIFQFINPFFEELIARAYLITQIKELTNSMALAIVGSVVFQVSYHFYQGFWTGLSHAGTFLVFSLYYAKTNRILAPILAHMIFDVSATLIYMLKTAH